MMYRAVVDASGRIERAYGTLSVEGLDMNAPPGPFVHDAPGPVRPDTDWWNGSAWAPRLPPPAPPEFVAGVEATWTGLQPGAVVTAISRLTGQTAGFDTADPAGAVQLKLPAGPWRLTVNEAFPAIAALFDIEVAEP